MSFALSSKPYDDACKTLTYVCPVLLVPMVNKFFGESWPRDARVELHPNEYIKRDDDMTSRYLDSVFGIEGRLYHIECQTDADGDIALRMTEYDFLVATRTIRAEGGVIKARFPRSALLGLWHGAVRREPYRIEIELPDGTTHSYAIPTLSMQEITIDEIFDEDLYFLIPLVLFRRERELDKIAADPARLAEFEAELDELRRKFTSCAESGRIDRKSARTVIWLLEYVSEHLAKCHQVIIKRVRDMGGEVLEVPTLKEWKEAEARGIQLGVQQGIQQGMQQGGLNMLFGLVRGGHLNADIASAQAGLPLAAFNAKMAEYEARPQTLCVDRT